MKKTISIILALAMCLSLITITATAAPGSDKESAIELRAGQSGTFTNQGGWWYRFQLSAASKVVITASLNTVPDNNAATIIVFDYSNDVRNEMRGYVVPKGSVADTTYDQAFRIGVQEDGRPLSRTGTYYLAEGEYYIWINCSLDDGITGTLKIDSIDPVSNTGGLARATARAVDPAREVIKQSRFDGNLVMDTYYYRFTLAQASEVSITKSVNPALRHNDGNPGSRLFLVIEEGQEGFGELINGVVNGERVESLDIRETDASLTKTITYSLPAGTYYPCLINFGAYPGTEYTLTFSMPGTTTPPPTTPTQPTNDIKVLLDGTPLTFDVPPQIINGRTMVPLRAIFEALGAEVNWDGATQTVTGTKDGTVVKLTIGNTSPTVNGNVVTIDQPGVVISGRTMVPLRFVGESFGVTVNWDGASSTVTITN